MKVETVLQHPGQPTAILAALERLADPGTVEVRCAVAYTTLGGCEDLMSRLAIRVGSGWTRASKTFVTGLDFGLTEPAALRYLRDEHSFALRLANTPGSSYHPKLYMMSLASSGTALVGSANLTRAAMTSNTEMAVALRFLGAHAALEAQWTALLGGSVSVSEADIRSYEARRTTNPPPLPPDPSPPLAAPPAPRSVSPLADAIAQGLNPTSLNSMWIEAGSMSSSGSHSQLELPRGANRFFGFNFSNYGSAHHTIGTPVLFAAGQEWADRPLTWHGNNRMERINLPTWAQGGFLYQDTAILFRRRGHRFQIQVAPWGSAVAQSWRNASAKARTTFRLGQNSPRICGFF